MSESRPHVTIIGAGVAGMSAALRLLEAGCPVTVIEKAEASRLGGQFGAVHVKPRYHEHAFHIFADWNQNFFALCKDIGLRRPSDPGPGEVAFVPRPAFLTLTPLDDPHYAGAARDARPPTSAASSTSATQQYFWKNANAGVAHWSDMMLYEYSILDLLSDDSLDERDLEGVPQPGQRQRVHALEALRLRRRRPAAPGAAAEGLRGTELPHVRALLPDLSASLRRVPSWATLPVRAQAICPRASGR